MKQTILPIFGIALLSVAQAQVLSVTSSDTVVEEPLANQKYAANAYQQNDVIHWWEEKGNVVLASDLLVDVNAAGAYDSDSDLTVGMIAAGTAVNSSYFYFDPVSGSTSFRAVFAQDVLGIIVLSEPGTDKFMASDFLANAATPGTRFNNRGLELSRNGDRFTLGADMRTLDVVLGASSPGDQIRVVTAVPEPASLAMLGVGLVGLMRRRIRR